MQKQLVKKAENDRLSFSLLWFQCVSDRIFGFVKTYEHVILSGFGKERNYDGEGEFDFCKTSLNDKD